MKVSHRWLAGMFPDGQVERLDAAELARGLTLLGLAVDEVRPALAGVEGVVLGKVLAAGPHPDADRLTLCTVTAGDGERQVVCGAPNVEVGAIYGYATPGARLPGDRVIERAEIRGVVSEGMLCSAPELGLDALGGAEGIWRVPGVDDSDLGRDLAEALEMDDRILDVDVPSNRADVLCHLGVAREVQWLAGARLARQDATVLESGAPAAGRVGVEVADAAGCARYLGRLIEGVTVGPSPAWMQIRLLALGMRPVNNVVDTTNYVMLECGQPLHAFDFDRLAGGRIEVRAAEEGEEFVTLDGKKRSLEAGMTLICDAERPVAIGGVMGGLDSEVGDATTTVFLEGAWFEPERIARTARALGLVSEASTRFARGVDPEVVEWAIDRAAALIVRTAGGTVAPGRVVAEPRPRPPRERIELRLERLAALVGRGIPAEEATAALTSLGFDVDVGTEGRLGATVPSWRFDVGLEVDLVEEVARLTGYDRVPLSPLPAPPVAPPRDPRQVGMDRAAAAARAAAFDEARTSSFVSADVLGGTYPVDRMVEIRNPISKAERFLRPFVFTPLSMAVAHNRRRGAGRVKLFEAGHAFVRSESGEVEERRVLALAASGRREPVHWSRDEEPVYDFWDLKGDVEDLVEGSTGFRPRFAPSDRAWLHPGRQAAVLDGEGREIGFCGEVHPRLSERWGLEGRLQVAELDLEPLVAELPPVVFVEFSREPEAERDLALVVPDGTPSAEVVAAIESDPPAHLAGIEVFDRYSGRQVPEGRYSLGVRLAFRAARTLTDEEIDRGIERLIARLQAERRWTLRGEEATGR
ncbi:MAG TPA: phenylalanine--tRNA ligase subunit beta [Gemmatimonadota bacterium]|nr:phenylalanine--tRNA ligase subunit beta [Gemmatimonadota bacterium]